MARESDPASPPERRDEDVARERACLRCRVAFQSAWSGERICRRCKASHGWRSGTGLSSAFSRGR
jgi:hypothetical protein